MLNIVDNYTTDQTQGEDGVVAIEYVLVAAAVAAALVGIFGVFGDELTDRLQGVIDTAF